MTVFPWNFSLSATVIWRGEIRVVLCDRWRRIPECEMGSMVMSLVCSPACLRAINWDTNTAWKKWSTLSHLLFIRGYIEFQCSTVCVPPWMSFVNRCMFTYCLRLPFCWQGIMVMVESSKKHADAFRLCSTRRRTSLLILCLFEDTGGCNGKR
jgi:hypothetical protein